MVSPPAIIAHHRDAQGGPMSDPVQVVREFCAAWEARDEARILDAFTEDGVYHNIPMQPAAGKDAIKAVLGMILGPATEVSFEIVNIVANGDVVMTERVDTFRMGERTIALPVMGVFEVRDGKIAAWRDYFDLATWTKQAAG
jgi:limonene-1,2-epoxide hydrolase